MNYDTDNFDDVESLTRGVGFLPPDGVALCNGPWGLSLRVTRHFTTGEVIYASGWWTVPDVDHSFEARVLVDDVFQTHAITRVHSVKYASTRSIDIPGCFMNHSCDPSSVSADIVMPGEENSTRYEQRALRDLVPGDEITCDYTLFDWDCDGHQFTCRCGAPQCYGEVRGFEGLPADVQARLLHGINYETERMWRQTSQGARP